MHRKEVIAAAPKRRYNDLFFHVFALLKEKDKTNKPPIMTMVAVVFVLVHFGGA